MAGVTLWSHGFVIIIFLVRLDNSGHRKMMILMVNGKNEFCLKDRRSKKGGFKLLVAIEIYQALSNLNEANLAHPTLTKPNVT